MAGHASVTETALMDAEVTAITGTVSAATGASHASVVFVPGGETRFRLPVGVGEAIHAVSVDVSLEASLRIPIPPLTLLTHHPERTERRTETVSLWRPGTSETVSETVTFTNPDGTTTERVLSATLSIPGETVYRDVTLTIVHPEHVKAEVVERSPVSRRPGTRPWRWRPASGPDDPFEALVLPEPEPRAAVRRADARRRRSERVVPTSWDGSGPGETRRDHAASHRRGPRVHGGCAGRAATPCSKPSTSALTAMSYAASGLCVFAIAWAGFVLMAEGADERGGGRAKSAVALAVVGLVLVLSAKGVAALLRSGVVPFPFP